MDTCHEEHHWTPSLRHMPASGVMPVHCTECPEIGYRIETKEKVDD